MSPFVSINNHLYLLVILLHIKFVACVVNIDSHGDIWYCNSNPIENVDIPSLKSNDLQRINKLEQVHVMTRHGTRVSHMNLQDFFPNETQYYQCDIRTITSRFNTDNNQYFIPMLQSFEDANQLLINSNCASEQSWPILIDQQRQNAQILINAYMSSDDKSQLFPIESINSDFIKLYTSNKERCMISTMAMASYLLNISASNSSTVQPAIETITNDVQFNPYAPYDNIICTQQEQYKLWKNLSTEDIFKNYINPYREAIEQTDEYLNTMSAYKEQGGIMVNKSYSYHDHPGFRIANFYCNGMDIPLDPVTFDELIKIGKQWTTVVPDTEEYIEKWKCMYHFMAIPMYKRVFDDIDKLFNNDNDAKKFILHSAHDSSIIIFLSGLNLYHGVVPYFAEMFTLEIYSGNSDDYHYLFRFVHKGKFIEYEHCKQEYESMQTELCDLNILLENGFKDVNITQREWAEQTCATLNDDCVCGYCRNNNMTNSDWSLEEYSFIIGIGIGLLVALTLFIFGKSIQRCREKAKRRGYNTQVVNDDPEDDPLAT